jgi:hypothetical protein
MDLRLNDVHNQLFSNGHNENTMSHVVDKRSKYAQDYQPKNNV